MSTAPPSPVLVPLADIAGRPLLWVRRRVFKERYELQADEATVATLRRRQWLGVDWEAETAEERWTILHRGFLHTRTEILATSLGSPSAVLDRRWFSRGHVQLEGGRSYQIRRHFRFWTARSLVTPDGTVLVRSTPSWLGRIRVEVAPSEWGRRELGLLLVLCGYDTAWSMRAERGV